MQKSNLFQVVSLIKMWDTLTPEPILDLVSDDITYESFWVFIPIHGKQNFLFYIEKKLNTIKDAVERNKISLSTSLVQIEEIGDEYFILLKHTITGTDFETLLRVSVTGVLISKIQLTPVYKTYTLKLVTDKL